MGLGRGLCARAARTALLAAVAAATPLVSQPARAQGLFEFLFGVRPAPEIVIRPSARPYGDEGRAPVRRTPRLDEPRKPPKYAPPEVLSGHLGRFLLDPTLRRGDIVATTQGLMVFQGSGGARHRPSDFVPVSYATAGSRRRELEALDRTLRRQPALVQSAPVAHTTGPSGGAGLAALSPTQ